MTSMVHLDWSLLLFTLLVVGSSPGALLCFRHMMYEEEESYKKPKRSEKDEQYSSN